MLLHWFASRYKCECKVYDNLYIFEFNVILSVLCGLLHDNKFILWNEAWTVPKVVDWIKCLDYFYYLVGFLVLMLEGWEWMRELILAWVILILSLFLSRFVKSFPVFYYSFCFALISLRAYSMMEFGSDFESFYTTSCINLFQLWFSRFGFSFFN